MKAKCGVWLGVGLLGLAALGLRAGETGEAAPTQEAIDGAVKRAGAFYHYCYLYAVERVGALAPGARLGNEDWYAAGARWLLNQQIEEGQWEDDSSMGPKETLGTCFALLFLRRATPPVITGATQPK